MENISNRLKDFFQSENIEYYTVLSYSDCREINPDIMKRENFTPKSVILFLLPYYSGETVNLSRYAASLDYHIAIRKVTGGLSKVLLEAYPESAVKGYGDHSPIDECHAALIGGLGILGENGLLINETYGTYVFIGDLVTDIPPVALGGVAAGEIKKCRGCGACQRACPTGILRGEGCDCLSAITQRKGELTQGEVALMRRYNTVWGCDECQSVCPYNREPKLTPLSFFYEERIPLLTSDILSSMDKDAFRLRAFAWRGRATVERNLNLLDY